MEASIFIVALATDFFAVAPTANIIARVPTLEALILNSSNLLLKCIPCIHHPVQFKKNQAKVQTLQEIDSELNVIISAYIVRPGLNIWPTNIGA